MGLFKESIPGFEKMFKTDRGKPAMILVKGQPKTMKSLFSYALAYNYLEKHPKEVGLYLTLEESPESLMDQVEGIGLGTKLAGVMKKGDTPVNRLMIQGLDDETIERFRKTRKGNIMDLIKTLVTNIKKVKPEFSILIVDSIGAINLFMDDVKENTLRVEMFHFFEFLRLQGIYAVFLMEDLEELTLPKDKPGTYEYLVDGVIGLKRQVVGANVTPSIQIQKMRKTHHTLKPYALVVKHKLGAAKASGLMIGVPTLKKKRRK